MSALTDAKKETLNLLKAALGKSYTPGVDELEAPPDPALGNLAFPCFALAKGMKRAPHEIAVELSSKIQPKGIVQKVEAKGPYVNFFFDAATFAEHVLKEIVEQREAYGTNASGNGKTVMVEYAQPNTHKEIHIGHLRNFFLGQSMIRLLQSVGYEVLPTSYINDLGMHVAKCLWGLKAFHEKEEVDESERMHLLGRAYTQAEHAAEADPKIKEVIGEIYQELEGGKGSLLALWKKTRVWSVAEIKGVFKELALPIDIWYFESDLVKRTHRVVKDLEKKGIVVKSQGALIVDLEAEKLGANLLVKTDGTLLYNAKDITLALRKEEEYHPDRSVIVVDVRQSLAMQQLFATMKRMGWKKELEHLAYEFVTLKEGAMSSRKGNIIRYQDFRDAMIDLARAETRKRHAEWAEKKIEKVARAIAFAAMRFGMLRQDPGKKITFDMTEAMSFDGCTGPYLLYTFARMKSIERKARRKKKEAIDHALLATPSENRLLCTLALYPGVIARTAGDDRLDRLALYLFDLCKAFSSFYDDAPVLQAETSELVSARLALVDAAAQVLKNGLAILGIEPVEEM